MCNQNKEEQRAIVFPFASPKKISPKGILCLGYEAWDSVKKLLFPLGIKEKNFSLCKIIETPHFSCVGPVVGAPVAVIALEQMIASGVTNIIALGCAGSLQPELLIGDYLLATGALSEEGTSAHYILEGKKPVAREESLCFLRKILKSQNISFKEGVVWTTDAPYRELVWKVKKYQSEHIDAVEMETSALFNVAQFRNISLSVLLVISDELFTYQWKKGFRTPLFKEKFIQLVKSILEELQKNCVSTEGM